MQSQTGNAVAADVLFNNEIVVEEGEDLMNKYEINILDDEEPNIRWDSAVALIKMNNVSGVNILEKLLDRSYYLNYSNINELEINNSMLTILALVSQYPNIEFEDELEFLAMNEKNVKIKEFSMKILSEHY